MEERMIVLETKSAYQEHLIQELNEVLIMQQKQMDALEKSLQKVREYMLQSDGQQGAAEPEAPPPHY